MSHLPAGPGEAKRRRLPITTLAADRKGAVPGVLGPEPDARRFNSSTFCEEGQAGIDTFCGMLTAGDRAEDRGSLASVIKRSGAGRRPDHVGAQMVAIVLT
jgi:hypothetical protein